MKNVIDFLQVSTKTNKNGSVEIYPKFKLNRREDLMIRGGDFYAIWFEDRGLWSTDEQDAIYLIDRELDIFADKYKKEHPNSEVYVQHLWDSESGMIDRWHKYCQKQLRDKYHMLDETLIFSNAGVNKRDYASKRLSYPLEKGDISAYDKLISTLYSPEERHKLEWAIGSIVSGDSKWIQKFMVLYGAAGTGKSTILNIIELLFEGYDTTFDAKALGSASASFALEPFAKNPLVAIQHDGDLSRIEDNTRLNSLVSHELMTVNEKFKSTYANRFKCFLFMGTNRPVKITDAKSGLIRRLIDVSPSGKKVSPREYKELTEKVKFELGAIAHHCLDVYLEDPGYYNDYIPLSMMGASNDFYNFVIDNYSTFLEEDGVSLQAAWALYKVYCEEAKVPYPYTRMIFAEELKNYFWHYDERFTSDDGKRLRKYYSGFRTDKFEVSTGTKNKKEESKANLIKFEKIPSIFDKERIDCPAQYATYKETPTKPWDNVKTKLSDLDTSRLHYVKVPENHIVIDFDIPDKDGNKCFELNLAEASKWPATYAELSKSGQGIHLHYIYSGDPTKLSRVYDDKIEVKVFTGKSALRRKLTKCNDLPIATISSGLPLKEDDKMIDVKSVQSEKGLRTLIKRNLNKEIHPATKPSIDFIYTILEEAYNSGLKYDITDMFDMVLAFAVDSTNQADYCVELVSKMKFKSEEPSASVNNEETEIVFYDVEVFPNLFLVNWKVQGPDKPVVRMINPKPSEVEELMKFRLVGFNCRRYDNHILYARMMGYTNEQLYKLSQRIISGDRNAFFGEAYNVSYTDVYDFSSKKQSLKKWEIELGIHHQELGLPWDHPVPEDMWVKVAEYCDNDVIATEAVFDNRKADFMARKIQVELVKKMHGIEDVTVNDTTNTLSTKIIFGNDRKPQSQFNYRNLAEPVSPKRYTEYREKFGPDYIFKVFDNHGLPTYQTFEPGMDIPDNYSILPFFEGYKYERGISTYLGEIIGEGGRVDASPGIHVNVWDGDIASQHPHSAIYEVLFGPKYTKTFEDVVYARVAIKHKDFDAAAKMLGGVLVPYLNEEFADDLAQALKIVINSIYGLTSAKFDNPFRDNRNKDNIVAKRGALFMTLLKQEVEKLGYKVAHIKTDSIKIPDSDDFIVEFVTKFGKEYGYNFETEAEFGKFCLVNDAVYIAQYKKPLKDKKTGEEIWWTATGTQFSVPYVFKTLFSKKPIEFDDMCEAKSVKSALYLDMNENLPDVTEWEKLKKIRRTDSFEWTKKEAALYHQYEDLSDEKLEEFIAEGHDYQFVGKIGNFCPVKPGCNGGILVREQDGKYYSATGSKGYRWLESELVRGLGREDDIDRSYYNNLVDEAVATISQYGDFEWFVSTDDYIKPIIDYPPWEEAPVA